MRTLLAALVLALIAQPAIGAELSFEFSGSVYLIDDSNSDGPAVSIGDEVNGYVTYVIGDEVALTSSPSFSDYSFPAGSMNIFVEFPSVGESFQLFSSEGSARSHLYMDAAQQYWRNGISAPTFSGSPTFPYAYAGGEAQIQFLLHDTVAPANMLTSTDLVDAVSDVSLWAASFFDSYGTVNAIEPVFLPSRENWRIQFRFTRMVILVSEDPVSIEAKSFGAVKALY